MKSIKVDEIKAGDEIRVNNPRLAASGTVKKVNRVNLVIDSTFWGHPVSFKLARWELIGGQMANETGCYSITA